MIAVGPKNAMGTIHPWHYNTSDVVTRIPNEIGFIWMMCYKVELRNLQCTPIVSFLNGCHSGNGMDTMLFLAKDENGNFLIVKNKD